MILVVEGFEINIIEKNSYGKKTILFLHGFTGSASDWDEIFSLLPSNYRLIAIDLPGHGKSSSKNEIHFYQEDFLMKIIDKIYEHVNSQKIILCGYSMGGRCALTYALKNQSKIEKIIFESTTAGIDNEKQRNERIIADNLLCKMINEKGVETFVEYWMNLDLFKSLRRLPEEKYEKIIKNKLKNNPVGLINSLNGFGTGRMNSLWNLLHELNLETMLVCGEHDKKFVEINKLMSDKIFGSRFEIVKNAGHNIHLEKPKEFTELLINFIS